MCQQELKCTPTPLLPARRGINTAQRWRLPGSLTHQTGQITTYCSYQETSLKTSLHYFTFKAGNGDITSLIGNKHVIYTSIKAIFVVVVFL